MMDLSSSAESSLLDELRLILLISCGKTFATDGIVITLAGTVNASTKVASMNDDEIISTAEMMKQLFDKRGDNIMMLVSTENGSWKWKQGGGSQSHLRADLPSCPKTRELCPKNYKPTNIWILTRI